LSISQKALGTLPENGNVFVGFSRVFLLGILIFKGLTSRRLYMYFGVKGLRGTGARISSIRKIALNAFGVY
jgi:hypothetical protein